MEEINEGFIIDSDVKAEWALKKIHEAQEERDRLLSLAQMEQERLKVQIEGIHKQYDRDTAFLSALLERYFDTVQHKVTKTQESYKLLSGSLVRKRNAPSYVRDEFVLLNWLHNNKLNKYVKSEESVNWAELKKQTAIVEGQVVLADTGEVIEGVTAEAVPDTFTVKF